jgi:prepilin-type N-terminal cleavage/methylation domain-containing protein
MDTPCTARRGVTLLELLLALALAALLAGVALPSLRRTRDALAARAARDEIAAAIHHTRALAVARGGASFGLDPDAGRFWIEVAGDTAAAAELTRWRVEVSASGAAGTVVLRFDGLGIGRLANREIRVRRGAAEQRLVVSSLGRVRT